MLTSLTKAAELKKNKNRHFWDEERFQNLEQTTNVLFEIACKAAVLHIFLTLVPS